MSKKRRPNSSHARMVRYSRAMLRSNHVGVIDAEASNLQTMINWKKAAAIATNSREAIANALCDIPHRWCIYLAALCCDQYGARYMKSEEVAPQGVYLASQLDDVIEAYSVELRKGCNPNQLQAMAWIAIPDDVTLDEAHAAHIFETFGAWPARSEHVTAA